MNKIDNMLIKQVTKLFDAMNKVADDNLPKEIAEIVKDHSAGAAFAALGSAWIPGAGGVAAAVACSGFIWTMYGRIGSEIDLPFSQNVLKSLASGVATNLASAAVGAIALSTALSFIPGLGNVGASVIMGATCYATTLASGYVYLKIITQLFRKGIDPTTLNEQELKEVAKEVASDHDVKDIIRNAKAEYKADAMNKKDQPSQPTEDPLDETGQQK